MADTMADETGQPKSASVAEAFRETARKLRTEVAKLIVGHDRALDELLAALFAGGHVLVEGVPGIGKTRLVQTVARALSLSFRRIQFTPDLMPGDITGSELLGRPATEDTPDERPATEHTGITEIY